MADTRSARASLLVGTGIFLSRVAGLARETATTHFLGTSLASDAFKAAIRIPNLLQNLFGEGVLSASFIPEYSGLLAARDQAAATRVAGAVGAALALAASVLVLVGVISAPLFVPLITPGFTGEKLALTIRITRILFPGAGLLVFSAWCLGILNSHRRFLLSYSAPVLWNAAMIAALLFYGPRRSQVALAIVLATASVVGSALQFMVQLPEVRRLAPDVRLRQDFAVPEVRRVFRNFVPAFLSRGVVQVSIFIDSIIASLIPVTGAVAALSYAQALYILPVSLFGMAVSAAELPAMSSATGTTDEIAAYLRSRLESGLARIAFFIVPSAVAFIALGDLIVGALFQSGRFQRADTLWVWEVLAGSAVGLLATTLGRLYASAYYALRDTRTPLNFALARVLLTTVLGFVAALWLPRLLGLDASVGAAGLSASAGIAGWVEFFLLRRGINARIGPTGVRPGRLARLWGAALLAAVVAWAARLALAGGPFRVMAVAALVAYGVAYLSLTTLLRIPDAEALTTDVLRRVSR